MYWENVDEKEEFCFCFCFCFCFLFCFYFCFQRETLSFISIKICFSILTWTVIIHPQEIRIVSKGKRRRHSRVNKNTFGLHIRLLDSGIKQKEILLFMALGERTVLFSILIIIKLKLNIILLRITYIWLSSLDFFSLISCGRSFHNHVLKAQLQIL